MADLSTSNHTLRPGRGRRGVLRASLILPILPSSPLRVVAAELAFPSGIMALLISWRCVPAAAAALSCPVVLYPSSRPEIAQPLATALPFVLDLLNREVPLSERTLVHLSLATKTPKVHRTTTDVPTLPEPAFGRDATDPYNLSTSCTNTKALPPKGTVSCYPRLTTVSLTPTIHGVDCRACRSPPLHVNIYNHASSLPRPFRLSDALLTKSHTRRDSACSTWHQHSLPTQGGNIPNFISIRRSPKALYIHQDAIDL